MSTSTLIISIVGEKRGKIFTNKRRVGLVWGDHTFAAQRRKNHMQTTWLPASNADHYEGATSMSTAGVLLSSIGRSFTPQWVWDMSDIYPKPHTAVQVNGGQMTPWHVLIREVPVRSIIRIGYCAEANVDNNYNIICTSHARRAPPMPPARLHVAIFPQTPSLAHLFAHHLLDSTAMLGLAAPLARAGYNLSWLHTGLLQHPRIKLRTPNWLDLRHRVELRTNRRIKDFVMAIAVPSSSPTARFELNGFKAPAGTRQPEPQRDWLPLAAYGIPFARRGKNSNYSSELTRCGHGSRTIGFISRAGARQLKNEHAVVAALRPLLLARNFTLQMLNETRHVPESFAALHGVVGVHGSAFGNIHTCAPGTIVVEIIGALMPRMWANFAMGLGMKYFAYVGERYPRSLWSFHAHPGGASDVEVNPMRFALFVAAALDGTTGSHHTCLDMSSSPIFSSFRSHST